MYFHTPRAIINLTNYILKNESWNGKILVKYWQLKLSDSIFSLVLYSARGRLGVTTYSFPCISVGKVNSFRPLCILLCIYTFYYVRRNSGPSTEQKQNLQGFLKWSVLVIRRLLHSLNSLLAPVVQTLDRRISIRETNCVIHWIDFYPVASQNYRIESFPKEFDPLYIIMDDCQLKG